MNNLLQNLQQNLQKIPQSAKVLAVALLLAAALVTWYLIAFRPAQDPLAVAPIPAPAAQPLQPGQAQPLQPAAQGQPGNPAPSAARPLEVVPLPFLRADGAAPAPATASSEGGTQTAQASASSAASTPSAPARPALPPNPFAPLVSESQTPPTTATASAVPQGQPSPPVPTAQPIPTQQARVQITPSRTSGLPVIPGLPGSRPTPTVTQTGPSVPVVTSRPSQSQTTGQIRTQGNAALPQRGNLNSGTGTPARPTASPSNPDRTAVAPVRPGGTVRLTPGGSANTAPGSITPGTGALPIRIAPLERELVTNRPPAVIQTPATPPVAETPATEPAQQPVSAPVETVETPSVGALDTGGTGPQSEFNPDFTQVQAGGRATPRPEIRGSTAQPQRPQTQQPQQPQQPQPQQQQQQQQPQNQTNPQTTPVVVVPPNPIEEYVKAQNLRLANVVLGSTNVAIFQSREGFLVLPVGSTLPNSEILIRSLNAREALLVQGTTELNLPVQNP